MSKVAKATIGLMIITLLSKCLGLGRDLVLSGFYGATQYSDIYLMSLDIARVVFQVVGVAISTTYIPLYFANVKEGGEKQGYKFTNNVLNITLSIGICISILAFIFTEPLVSIFAKGFKGQVFETTVLWTRIILFGTIFSGLQQIMQSHLQSKGEYFIPGMTGFPFNIIVITSIVLSKSFGPIILPIGAFFALASQFFFQLPRARKLGYRYEFIYDPKDKYIKEMVLLTLPVIIGVSANQLNTMVDRTLASSLAVGSISALKYADRLNTFVLGLFISSITIVIYPMLSKLKANSQDETFKLYIRRSINTVILMILPITAVAMVMSEPIVRILFERGAFDTKATIMTAKSLYFYSIGLIGLSLKNVIANVFYSLQDTKTPMLNGVLAVIINIVLNLILIKYMALSGIALATSISSIVCVIILLFSLRKRVGSFDEGKIFLVFVKTLFATLLMSIFIKYIYRFAGDYVGRGNLIELIILLVTIGLGGIFYAMLIKFLKIEESEYAYNAIKNKLLSTLKRKAD